MNGLIVSVQFQSGPAGRQPLFLPPTVNGLINNEGPGFWIKIIQHE